MSHIETSGEPAVSSPRANRVPSLRDLGRALHYRNYQLFFIGQGISLMGTWTQRTALAWLVFRLTRSEGALGVVVFTSQILTFILAPLAGVLADRLNKLRLLILTQAVSMVQALALAALVLLHPVAANQIFALGSPLVLGIIGLSAILGMVNAFDVPIRQSFQIEMIEKREDLPNAIALNSFLFNGSRMIGPAVAGVLIHWLGEGVCFLINGLSFIAVLWALLCIRVTPRPRPASHSHPLQTLWEGFQYAFGFLPIRAILTQLAFASLLGMGAGTLMPVFAGEILRGDARTLGLLNSSNAAGAMFGVFYLLSRRSPQGLGKIVGLGGVLYGIGTFVFGQSAILWVSIAFIAVSGFGSMVQTVSCNTLLQTICEDDKRGRVMSLYTAAVMGMMPLGGLLAGMLGQHIGAPAAVSALGVGCALVGAYFMAKQRTLGPLVHPIYVQRGLIAELPTEPGVKIKFRM